MSNIDIPVTPDTDLQALQYRAVDISGTLALNSYNAVGLMQTITDSGEDGTIRLTGRSKFVAGGAITRGARMQVTSGGFMTLAASGDLSVGICEITVTSGSVGRGVVDLVTPMYHVNSSGF